MKTQFHLILTISLIFIGCTQMSESYTDKNAGINGGFEVSKNGIPANWLLYTPKTVPEGNFKIILDSKYKKEGNQSLKFDIKSCAGIEGWRSPGLTKEYNNMTEGQYKLSFWVMNKGTEFSVKAGGVSDKSGSMKNLIKSDEQINNWEFYECNVSVPKGEWLRIEINLLKPGEFWIDDLKIE
ncbi:hypothetical protein [Marinigracilibium pacificum]|uniref:CBM-cenC domain-containing protein n=1 Tax=Marinigracilibium pacificum TaxID=2729599 RepID=A0A848J4I8_9BACT|nr:hypothetical protein [Marinigracilibium pacificum]NMM50671.1 hypothetical protein [Marinigracilibium pacificum]